MLFQSMRKIYSTNTKMNNGIFTFDSIQVFFKHTDSHGFVHPYNYLEWTSYVREAFFQENVPMFTKILQRPIKMMTSKISSQLLRDNTFGDILKAQLTISKIKKCSFDVIVRFINKTDGLVDCFTIHTLVFIDSRNEKFTFIPEELKNAVVCFEELENGT